MDKNYQKPCRILLIILIFIFCSTQVSAITIAIKGTIVIEIDDTKLRNTGLQEMI